MNLIPELFLSVKKLEKEIEIIQILQKLNDKLNDIKKKLCFIFHCKVF